MSIERILIVGLGSIGKRHLRLVSDFLPEADIRVLRHQQSNLPSTIKNKCFFNLEEALKFKPHVTVLSNPAPFHIPIAQAFAEIGTHLLIEKPLSTSQEGVLKLIKTCHQKQNTLLIGYNLRFLTSLQQYRHLLINDKIVGNILSVRCEIGQYLPSWRPETNYRDSVSAQQALGGGVLFELSHELDYLRWIFGDIDWVYAKISKQSDLEINVEDTAHIILGFTKTEYNSTQVIGTVNLDFIRQDTTRLCTVIGDKSSLRWDGLTGKITLYDTIQKKWSEIFQHSHHRDESYMTEWSHFIKCVNNIEQPFITGEDGLKVLQLIEAIRLSSNCDKKIYLADAAINEKTL
ncbi:MAG: Gfo/Idh/MocA family oxidoreductase [Thiothrix sp.]|nr:MAG: Gfo/Idh/MocA family oxidoreductase [Thiothrix sp.]